MRERIFSLSLMRKLFETFTRLAIYDSSGLLIIFEYISSPSLIAMKKSFSSNFGTPSPGLLPFRSKPKPTLCNSHPLASYRAAARRWCSPTMGTSLLLNSLGGPLALYSGCHFVIYANSPLKWCFITIISRVGALRARRTHYFIVSSLSLPVS